MRGERYRLMDLLNAADITPGTYDNWQRQKLTVPAVREGRYSWYPPEALARLLAIKQVMAQNRTLRDIKDYLDPPTDDG